MTPESVLAKQFLDFLKLAPRYLITLGIAAAFLLFSSEEFLKRLSVYDFTQHNRSWLNLTLIITSTLFFIDRAIAIFNWIKYRIVRAEGKKRRLKRLHSLTEDEKQILRFYIAKQTKTNHLRFNDGVVNGLEAHEIIFRTSSVGNMIDGFAYNISDFVWEYLHKNQWLLSGTTEYYRTDKTYNWLP